MAADRILIDTSLIIDFFRKKNKEKTLLAHLIKKDRQIYISTLSVYELYCGAKSKQLLKDTETILTLFAPIDLDFRIAKMAASLYRQLKKENRLIQTVDLLIASTALTHTLALATLNKDHFARIGTLRLYDF